LAGAAGTLLPKEFAGAAGDLATATRVMRAHAGIRLLPHHRLVHHRYIWLDAKDRIGYLNGPDLGAGLVKELCFHRRISSVSFVKS
jgi:hypothetical protein